VARRGNYQKKSVRQQEKMRRDDAHSSPAPDGRGGLCVALAEAKIRNTLVPSDVEGCRIVMPTINIDRV
jgi:hypothetical protein